MKGVVFLGDRRLELREFPVPDPTYGEALVRIEAAGICGSDLHVYRGDSVPGQIAGHEPSGVVEAVGPGVRRVKIGDRVSVHHHDGCGVCDQCAEGETVACKIGHVCYGVTRPGAFAEYMVANEANCIPLPEPLTFGDGAFGACVGTTSFAALRRLAATAHESLAVFGLGPVGLSAVLVGKAMGLRVIGMDILQERLELGLACGADEVVDGTRDDVVETIRTFGRIPGIAWQDGVDCIVETSGSAPARRAMLPSIRRKGRIAIVGVGSDEEVINPSNIHGTAATIIGSVVFPLGWSWDLMKFMVASGMSFEPAVTHRFSLDDAEEALRIADEGRCGKVMFTPHAQAN